MLYSCVRLSTCTVIYFINEVQLLETEMKSSNLCSLKDKLSLCSSQNKLDKSLYPSLLQFFVIIALKAD